MKIRAVTLDAGGTLFEPWPSVGSVYAREAALAGVPGVDPGLLEARFVAAWKARVSFDYTRRSWERIVRTCFEGMAGPEDTRRIFNGIYDAFARAHSWKVFPEVREAVEQLASRGMRMAVVSNFDERLGPLLRELGLDRHFDVILASGPLGVHKPDSAIFLQACRRLGVSPAETIHVGDGLEEDVEGARRAGLGAVHLKRRASRVGAGEIRDLGELGAFLNGNPAG